MFDAHSSGVSAYGRKQLFISVDDDLRGLFTSDGPVVWTCSNDVRDMVDRSEFGVGG